MFWVYVTTIPLTLITVANLIAAWIDRSIRRKWWLSAAVIVMLERLATFSYFSAPARKTSEVK
jgi:predicted acyltransferase